MTEWHAEQKQYDSIFDVWGIYKNDCSWNLLKIISNVQNALGMTYNQYAPDLQFLGQKKMIMVEIQFQKISNVQNALELH